MWPDIGLLLLGALCAGLGGEAFVRGAVRLAALLRVRPGLIGLTLAAFATSAPELMVAVTAALEGAPEIALGNTQGANAVNLGLALGISLLLGPSRIDRGNLNRDVAAVVGVSLVTGVALIDGTLGRGDAVVLAAVFALWLYRVLKEEREGEALTVPVPRSQGVAAVANVLAGLALLVVSGETFVRGAIGLAERQGWDLFVVGATLVAFGTTLPELATSLVAKLRGQDEVGLGTLFGSCVFNAGVIVPAAALIRPPAVPFAEVAVALGAVLLLVAASVPLGRSTLSRERGLLLLGLYAAYVAILIATGPAGR